MKIETAFTPGDTAFILSGQWGTEIVEYTVGQVRIKVTDSPGAPEGAEIDGMNARDFSNYAPQSAYEEEVMCVETGIGSGSIYTYGKSAFTSREAAERGVEAMKVAHAEAIAQEEAWKRERRERDLAYHRQQVAALESGR